MKRMLLTAACWVVRPFVFRAAVLTSYLLCEQPENCGWFDLHRQKMKLQLASVASHLGHSQGPMQHLCLAPVFASVEFESEILHARIGSLRWIASNP